MVVQSLKLKNKSYYFWDDIVYLEDLGLKLLKVDRKECSLGFDVYYIAYVTKKPKYGINSVNPLYIKFRSVADRVANVGSSNDKYLLIDSVDVNKKAFEMLDKLWKSIKDEINDLISDDEVKFGTMLLL